MVEVEIDNKNDPDSEMEVKKGSDLVVRQRSSFDINEVGKLQSRGNTSGNIFEIVPRCSIAGPDGDNGGWMRQYVSRREKVLAATSGGGDITGITVGSKLLVFERGTDEPPCQIQFSAPIDFVVWRRSIILVGLSSSVIILVDPKSFCVRHTGKPLAQLDAISIEKSNFFVDAFIHSNPDPTKMDMIVVSRAGIIYKFSNIALSDGTMDSTFDQNTSLDVDIGAVKEVTTLDLCVQTEISCACSPSRTKVMAIERSGRVSVLDAENFNQELSIPNFFVTTNIFNHLSNCNWVIDLENLTFPKKLVIFEGVIFVLFSNGSLNMFCGADSVLCDVFNPSQEYMFIHDFTLVSNTSEGTVKLWTLFEKCGENYLGIFDGPACFSLEFSFPLPTAEIGKAPHHFIFPHNVSPFEEPVSIVEMAEGEIQLYQIVETSTDLTLQKLLAQGKYAKAEDLAILYKKDLDIVRKAEAKEILLKLRTNRQPSAAQDLFSQMLQILEKINDAEFVCKFCLNAQLQKVEWVKEILELGRGRVSQCSGSETVNALLLTMKKFFTFELVLPGATIEDWNAFMSEDNNMFLQSMKFLQDKCFDKCERVWKRHSEDLVPEIGMVDFLSVFTIIFEEQLAKPESRSLLRTVLPFAIEKATDSATNRAAPPISASKTAIWPEIKELINLILRQVLVLERHVNWPLNALEFIKALNSVIMDEIKRMSDLKSGDFFKEKLKMTMAKYINKKLEEFQQVLEELSDLKKNHSLKIPYQEYTNEYSSEVISKLLFKLFRREDIERFVTEFLQPYAKRKQLSVEKFFLVHIKLVLGNIKCYQHTFNIPHEERMVCLVNLCSSSSVKLKYALLIAEEWPVPWSRGIDNMVKQLLSVYPRDRLNAEGGALYDALYLTQKKVPYRCVLRKYLLDEQKMGIRLHLTLALTKIIKLKKEGWEKDCEELLNNVPDDGLKFLDVNRVEYLSFCVKMYDPTIPAEEVASLEMLQNDELRKSLFHRVVLEMEQIESSQLDNFYSSEEKQRVIEIFSAFAAHSKDPRDSIVAKLKKFVPNIKMKVVHQEDFPYNVLTEMLEQHEAYLKNPDQLIKDCKTLSRITNTYLPDVLMMAGAFFVEATDYSSQREVIWYIVEQIVGSPLPVDMNNTLERSHMLKNAACELAQYLLPLCPSLSLEQMETLDEFLCRLMNLDEISENITRSYLFYRIFLNLKEHEIPLEHEFLEVFKWCAGEPKPFDFIMETLTVMGETLLKFGDEDMFHLIFKTIIRQLNVAASKGEILPAAVIGFRNYSQKIKSRMEDLLRKDKETEKEGDPRLEKLVKQLNDVGIRVNEYALKQRNKEKLLEQLLDQKNFLLASNLATTFSVYEHSIWSRILQGLTSTCKVAELRSVLESVRTVPQLWMLAEFANAWKRVSEDDESFFDLCPIPLKK